VYSWIEIKVILAIPLHNSNPFGLNQLKTKMVLAPITFGTKTIDEKLLIFIAHPLSPPTIND
jgi:hypothetical protein